MAVILWAIALSLLTQGCLCAGEINKGCMKWRQHGDDVCCDACHPGHRLVGECGRSPKDLCTPCESETFTTDPKANSCSRCTQCVGAQFTVKECTITTDTQCGCKEGLICGDDRCSFCVKKCDRGQEPTEKRSCRPCPDGTFNDKIHQMCKPWSTKCPSPDQKMVALGDAFADIKCVNVSRAIKPAHTEQAWPLVLYMVITVVLTVLSIIVIIIVTVMKKICTKEKEPIKPTPKTPIIRTPTDDPRTLIAIECSFHEAQQEQGSSSESLVSKDSSDQLIA